MSPTTALLVATSNTVMVFAAASVTYRTYGSAQ
jgi:hypothetical protein